ncbi:transposable element Tcb1 transposase [Trichonephila clavipes]|nr:transposable element Tcb1 transposase [Trichonephila clavipes]
MKLSLLTSPASVCNTAMVGFESGDTVESGCYAPPHWSCTGYYENMWSMVAQRLTQITPLAATPDQLWQRVEAAWFVVPQEHIQSFFESMPRRVAGVISNNGGYSGY